MRRSMTYDKKQVTIAEISKNNPHTRKPFTGPTPDMLNEIILNINQRIAHMPSTECATGDETRICWLIAEIQRLKALVQTNNTPYTAKSNTRYYQRCECDGSGHTDDNRYSMDIAVQDGLAHCYCHVCGYNNTIDLVEKRSIAVSQEPGKAFFISA